MKALVWTGPGKLDLTERTEPEPQPGQVLIRSVSVGLCGTDAHVWQGSFSPAVPPLILGHELAGIVAATCDDARGFRAGDRVVINPTVGCGQCPYCLQGRRHHCRDRKTIGLAGWDGGLADYYVSPVDNVFVIPGSVSWLDAACMDTLANVVHGLDLAPACARKTVAVFGCGASGLCFIQLCRLRGASRIIAVDISNDRLDWAKRFGADHLVNAGREDAPHAIRALTDGLGVDLAIEASGALTGPGACIQCAANGGSVLIFGVYEKPVSDVDFQDQHRREITIYGSSGAPDTFPLAVDLVSRGQVRLAPMVTHQLCLNEVPSFLAAGMTFSGTKHPLKTVVSVNGMEGC